MYTTIKTLLIYMLKKISFDLFFLYPNIMSVIHKVITTCSLCMTESDDLNGMYKYIHHWSHTDL